MAEFNFDEYQRQTNRTSSTEEEVRPISSAPPLFSMNGCGLTIYGDTLYFILLAIPIIPLARYKCTETSYNHYSFSGKLRLHNWQRIWQLAWLLFIIYMFIQPYRKDKRNYGSNTKESSTYSTINDEKTTYSSPSTSSPSYPPKSYTYPNESSTPNSYSGNSNSPYSGNQLKNGDSPLNSCFGSGIYGGNAKLTVRNGGNSDAIVCLFDVNRNKTIRNEYIRKNSSFSLTNIKRGYYKIRVFYGNDWNPELANSCGKLGFFESNVNFSEFDQTQFFEDDGYSYTDASVTLYSIAGGNATTSNIDQSTFFRN